MWRSILLGLALMPVSLFSQQTKGLQPVSSTDASLGGDTWAVVVGISDYQDAAIPDLRFADAIAFAGFLQSDAGGSLDEDHLKILINGNATAAQFAIALDWLWEVVQENDRVIIYFSGHGDVEKRSITQPGYLLCWDAPSRVYMAGGAFNVRDLQDVVSTLSTQNKAKVLLITDACRAGKLSGSGIGGSQATAANLAKQYVNEIKILSCQPDEYSIEGEQWGGGRGAFSYHLLNGLYGMADDNGDQQVNLKEIGRYIEDHVTPEAAPQNQNPMTVGGNMELISTVSPHILAQVRKGQSEVIQQFAAIDSRGIEEDVLARADSQIIRMYFSFKKSLLEKRFLYDAFGEVTDDCADVYYRQLIRESSLERLHASMRRNYAAALQDDAQQVLNNWLIDDPDENNLSKVNMVAKYQRYPEYIERASELLTREHYMYPELQARKLFFEGYLMHIKNRNKDQRLGEQILEKYQASLKWQPGSPHVYRSMGIAYFFQFAQADSAEYYMAKATEAAPSWVSPYSSLAFMYLQLTGLHSLERAHYFLGLADQVDSTAIQTNIWYIVNKANYYLKAEDYENAEVEYLKAIQLDSTICAPVCNLGIIYFRQGKLEEAIIQFTKVLELDSTLLDPNFNLANIYMKSRQYAKAELHTERVVELDSTFVQGLAGLARIYMVTNRVAEGEALFEKAFALDSTSIITYMTMGSSYAAIGDFDRAEQTFLKLMDIDSACVDGIVFLGNIYAVKGRQLEANQEFEKLLRIALHRIEHHRTDEAELIINKSNLMVLAQKQKRDLCKAVLYHEQNAIDKAFEHLELALESHYNPEDPFLNVKTYHGFDSLRADENRWDALRAKYFAD